MIFHMRGGEQSAPKGENIREAECDMAEELSSVAGTQRVKVEGQIIKPGTQTSTRSWVDPEGVYVACVETVIQAP